MSNEKKTSIAKTVDQANYIGQTNTNKKVLFISISALFAALVYIFTALFHIPINAGYIHVGDAFIYLVASVLPLPYAIAAAVIGAGFSDLLSGFAIWVPGTVVIKLVTVLLFTSKKEKIFNLRNVIALVGALLVCVGGYYVYEGIITGNWLSAIESIPSNIIQSVVSAILYIVVGTALDRIGIKKQIKK